MRPFGSPENLEHRRLKAVRLLRQGHRPTDVARQLNVTYRSVARWKKAFRKKGPRGIRARPAPGRPSKLEAAIRTYVRKDLLQGARAAGYPTDLWTCPRVADFLRKNYEVSYHVDHIGRLLRSLGCTPQKPERRAIERDERQIRHWIIKTWPAIKKNVTTRRPSRLPR